LSEDRAEISRLERNIEQQQLRYDSAKKRVAFLERDVREREYRLNYVKRGLATQDHALESRDPATRLAARMIIPSLKRSLTALESYQSRRTTELTQQRRERGQSFYLYNYYMVRRGQGVNDYWKNTLQTDLSTLQELPPDLKQVAARAAKEHIVDAQAELKNVNASMVEARRNAIQEQWNMLSGENMASTIQSIYGTQGYLAKLIAEIEEEIEDVLPQLSRIKVRLYNMARTGRTPQGMFQGFFEIDALVDPITGEVDWSWWLTQEQLQEAKYHMVGYFKGMSKWNPPQQVLDSYLDPTGIPGPREGVNYKRKANGETYTRNVPQEYVARAERMKMSELITGESSAEPKRSNSPRGVNFDKVFIVGDDGQVRWQENRGREIPASARQRVLVKEELHIPLSDREQAAKKKLDEQ